MRIWVCHDCEALWTKRTTDGRCPNCGGGNIDPFHPEERSARMPHDEEATHGSGT